MLLDSFEAIAAVDPDRTAIKFDSGQISYSELNSYANQLARWLLSADVQQGDPVCVLFDPSPQSILALMAILKVGAVYAPLDVEYPAKRIHLLTHDLQPKLVLTRSSFRHLLPDDYPAHALDNVRHASGQDNFSADNIGLNPKDNMPAYVFFTSGTTGKPKGVVATRSNLIHYTHTAIHQFSMNHQTVMPSVARVTFSISLLELLCPLLAGGCVRIIARDTLMDIPSLAAMLTQLTMIHMGPSLLSVLLRYLHENPLPKGALDHIRHLSSGGDQVKPELLKQMCTLFPNAEVYVVYGCTELSCMVSCQQVSADTIPQRPIIGKPFPRVTIDFHDPQGNSVTYPKWGEMLISGPGVTQGYLRQPELTAESYVERNQRRYYRSGDMARQRHDGVIEFLGRRDFQVQIHGIRIELGEVEAHLTQIPGILDAIASGHINSERETQLVAYLMLDADRPANYEQIKSHMTSHLPKYMVPHQYVVLDRFPQNNNLKVDRNGLPAPGPENLLQKTIDFVAPDTAMETQLLSIWRQLFHRQDIGTHHDFFDLGGDSLLAIDLIIALEKQFQIRISLSELLRCPTVSQQAVLLDQPRQSHCEPEDLMILQQGKPGPAVFLIHGAIVYKDVCEYLPRDQTVCVLYRNDEADSLGHHDISSLMATYSSIPDLAEHYLKAIKEFQPQGPYYLVGFSIGGLIAIEMSQRLTDSGEQVGDIILIDTHVPAFAHQAKWRKALYHVQQLFQQGLPHIKYLAWKILMQFQIQSQNNATENSLQDRKNKEELRRLARNNAASGYQPPISSHKTVLFKATERPEYEIKDRFLGWGNYLSQLEVHDLPGNHNQLLNGDNAFLIAIAITQHCLKNL